MKARQATVIIPTTGDRGDLLRFSVASVRNQTVQDFEVHIIGDGVSSAARDVIAELTIDDSRIFFHDFPKHERRGEPYRHQVIKHSSGRNIFYLCDRDLMLPNHIETLCALLRNYNFASTSHINVRKDKRLTINQQVGYFGPGSQVEARSRLVGNLSCVAHSREMYDRLAFGWRTTPIGKATDIHMWEQFIAHPACRTFSSPRPTVMYFKRGDHPGDPVEERAKELAFWSEIISTHQGIDDVFWTALGGLMLERHELARFRASVIKDRQVSKP